MGAVSLFWQLFIPRNKERSFESLLKGFLGNASNRSFTFCTVRSDFFFCLLCVESQHFQLSLIFSPICEYWILTVHSLHHTYSEMPYDIVQMDSFAGIHKQQTRAVQRSTYLWHTQSFYNRRPQTFMCLGAHVQFFSRAAGASVQIYCQKWLLQNNSITTC